MVSPEEHEQTLAEESEVLESIYADELEFFAPDHLRIRVVPEDCDEQSIFPVLALDVQYTPQYPDEVPEISIAIVEDEQEALGAPAPLAQGAGASVPDAEASPSNAGPGVQALLAEVQQVAVESVGMPMVFTLGSHLREALTRYLARKTQQETERASRQREAELRAEEEKFRGTAVTVDRFRAWRQQFEMEEAAKRQKAEENLIASMSNKEREEYKRMKAKPTGRELFSKSGGGVEEDKVDESVREVDWSLYTRDAREQQTLGDDEDGRDGDGLVARDSDDE
ncbi:Protein gir2 [Malassezia sp. CBS 17886]|nr:Protein gir2 [Malassezia sp. CBS 17886]